VSDYYKPKRQRNRYDPAAAEPFRVSRTKLDLFLRCPRCFYLDRRLGIAQPPGYPFSLNAAVDALLKREFDAHRAAGTRHPLMEEHGIDAVPFAHERMDEWRDSLRRGVQHVHEPTNLCITGGVDDIWVNPKGELHVVDYKATSKNDEVSLDADWQVGYKRQMELYQWLLRRNGFTVSPTGYFVYCNGDASRDAFDQKLHFDVTILPYEGDDSWVEPTLHAAHACLNADALPAADSACDFCAYRKAAGEHESDTP
jgi:hypothetical protein